MLFDKALASRLFEPQDQSRTSAIERQQPYSPAVDEATHGPKGLR